MRRSSIDPASVEAEISGLPGLSLTRLRERWLALYGRPAPQFFRRKFLVRAVAYQIQVAAFGGLSAASKRRLQQIAAAAREGRDDLITAGPRIRAGTRLIRRWHQTTHTVTVLEDGFDWNGARHKSLSGVAKAITGTNWNGHAFFGVKRRPARNKNAARKRSASDA